MPLLTPLQEVIERLRPPSDAVLVTDGRLPAITGIVCISAVGPEAALGGPLASLADGAEVILDMTHRNLDADPSSVLAAPPHVGTDELLPRAIMKYAQLVGPAVHGASTHPGAAAELMRYADL